GLTARGHTMALRGPGGPARWGGPERNTAMTRRLLRAAVPVCLLSLVGAGLALPKDPDPYDQSGVPLEVQPKDPDKIKIVLVAGRQSHGPGEHEFFAGCAVLMKLLKQTPGVFPVMARDGWPKNPKTFENAKAVVFFM